MNEASLSNLRDIVLPAEPGLWPLAPGMWLLLSVLLSLLVWALWTQYDRRKRNAYRRAGLLLLRPIARSLARRLDHAEYGAVPLLGVSAPVFVAHGSSSARSIRSAIRSAKIFVESRLDEAIEQELRSLACAHGGRGPTGTVGGHLAAAGRGTD